MPATARPRKMSRHINRPDEFPLAALISDPGMDGADGVSGSVVDMLQAHYRIKRGDGHLKIAGPTEDSFHSASTQTPYNIARSRHSPAFPAAACAQEQHEKGISPLVFAAPGHGIGGRGVRPLGPAAAGISHKRWRRMGTRRPRPDRQPRAPD